MIHIRISQLPVCDACVLVLQWESGIRDHMLMWMFCISVSQLPVYEAHVLDVQLKSGIRNMCLCACSVYVYINCLFAMRMSLMFKQNPG